MPRSKPPKWAERFLEKILPEQYLEEIQGDLEEVYLRNLNQYGDFRAKWKYIFSALGCLRLMNMNSNSVHSTSITLILSYFKTGFRFLWKTRRYSFLNILGLSLAISIAVLANLFITDQLSYDRFHKNIDHLYRLVIDIDMPSQRMKVGGSSYIMGDEFSEKIPGIELTSRICGGWGIYKSGEENISTRLHFVDPSIFKMLDFEWIKGRGQDFGDPAKVILSESFFKLIGEKESFSLTLDGQNMTFLIIGIIKDMPINSSFKPSIMLPFTIWKKTVHERRTKTWMDINMNLLVMTQDNADPEAISQSMTDLLKASEEDDDLRETELILQPFKHIHSDTEIYTGNGLNAVIKSEVLIIVSLVGILCLIISSLNYANFSLGHYLVRSREVGVRKILGARPHFIWMQFFSETFITTVIALFLAAIFTTLLLPYYAEFVGVGYQVLDLLTLKFLGGCFFILIMVTLLSGGYPAITLSNFKLINALKGININRGKQFISRVFLTSQVALAIFMIIGSITISKQLNYLLDFELGYNDKHLLRVELMDDDPANAERFRTALREIPGLNGVSFNSGYNGTGLRGEYEKVKVRHLHTDQEFAELLELKFLEGRNLRNDLASDNQNACLINKTLANRLGLENPVGEILPFDYGDLKNPIIVGMVDDFYFRAPKFDHSNLVIYLSPQYPFQDVLIRMNSNYSVAQINQIRDAFLRIYDPLPFSFEWVEESNRRQMASETRIRNTALAGSIIALLLVLFGLTSVLGTYIQQRMKEIVIRKISGGSTFDFFYLLSKRFSVWLFLGFLLGSFPAYYFLNQWLDEYPSRINLGYNVAFLGIAICILVFIFTLSIHMRSISRVNPVNFLNTE